MFNKFFSKKINYINFFILFFLIILIIIKSIRLPITYDEAYSFLNYVANGNYFNLGLANNHLLNTLSMGIFSKFSIEVFYLRLPNIFAGILFIFTAYKFSQKNSNSFFCLIIFLCNPLIIDFFSHARGYGITSSLNFLALYILIYSNFRFKYEISLILIYLGSFSIFINLLNLYILIFLSHFFFLENKNKVSFYLTNSIFLILSWPILNWVFEVTKNDRPVFGNEIEVDTLNSVISIFGFLDTYYFNYDLIKILFFILILYVLISKTISVNFYTSFFIFTLISLVLLPLIFNRPLPSGRILIPFIPIFQIFLIEIFENNLTYKVKILITVLLISNFLSNLSLSNSLQWGKSVDLTAMGVKNICINPNFSRPEINYYVNHLKVCDDEK